MKFILVLILLCFTCFAYSKTMAELNPQFEEYMIQALKPRNEKCHLYKEALQPFALFHFSDIHGGAEELTRLLEFYKTYNKYFDDIIHTGDNVVGKFADDFTYWGKIEGANKVLNVIGNHDSAYWTEKEGFDWTRYKDKELYDKFFAPYIKDWNVVCDGHTYYYKDYPNKNIRLIVIDVMLTDDEDTAQHVWFEKVLNDAKEKKLNIIIGNHFACWKGVRIESEWNNTEWESSAWFDLIIKYEASVDKFIKDGGEFICWFGGDTHWDFFGYNKDYPNQLSMCVDAANMGQCEAYSDIMRVKDTRSQDLANVIVVDTTCHVIKFIRVGANINSYLKQRNTITIDYKTLKVISEH